jgi:hypothetical protein
MLCMHVTAIACGRLTAKFRLQVGVPNLVAFINKCDAVEDEEFIDIVEMELRELLSFYQYDGDNTPMIRCVALCYWLLVLHFLCLIPKTHSNHS